MKNSGQFARIRHGIASVAVLALGLLAGATHAQQSPSITVASTTSTEQSGLFGHILPQFRQAAFTAFMRSCWRSSFSSLLWSFWTASGSSLEMPPVPTASARR